MGNGKAIRGGSKKKIDAEIEVYFPDIVDKSRQREYYANLKIKTEIELSKILEEPYNEQREKDIDDYFYSVIKPEVFWGKDGFTARHNKNFESSCVIISQSVSKDPKTMNALEYLQTLEELCNQSKKYSK